MSGLRVVVCEYMVGAKNAIRVGDSLHVSPAMFDLIKNAKTQGELQHVIRHIGLLDLGENMLHRLLPSPASPPSG